MTRKFRKITVSHPEPGCPGIVRGYDLSTFKIQIDDLSEVPLSEFIDDIVYKLWALGERVWELQTKKEFKKCEHPPEKIQGSASGQDIGGRKYYFQCECGAMVRPKTFEEIR